MLGAPPVNWSRLFVVLFVLVVGIGVQIQMKNSLGWTFDMGLSTLLVSSIFLTLPELSLLILVALFLLVSKPVLGMESILLITLPIAAFFVKRLFSWELWITNLIQNGAFFFLFYGILGPSAAAADWVNLLNDAVFTLFFAGALFFVLEYIYRSQFD